MKKKLIRNGVFETNSSSAHSVSLAESDKDFILDTLYPDGNGKIILTGGEFGWDWFKHNDALTKANYAAVAHQNNPETLIDLIKEQTGAEEVVFDFSDEYNHPNWSYIDHDSYGVCPSGKEDLKNFIFNKNSWLFGGNDNSTAAPNFYDVPILKKDGTMVVPTYKFKLTIEGLSETVMLKKMPTVDELDNMFYGIVDRDTVLTQDGRFKTTNLWSSDDDYFEYAGWRKLPNMEKKLLFFTHRNINRIIIPIIENKFRRKYDFKTDGKELRDIENELINNNDKRIVRSKQFRIDAI